MKQIRILSVLTALLLCTAAVPKADAQEFAALNDSVPDYTESTDTINNPGAGYTSTLWYTCRPGDTPVKNPSGNLVLMFINIGAFSSGANGTTGEDGTYTEGTDFDLDEAFFRGLRGTLENCRSNGCTVALRFRYDENGKTNPEPSTFDQVLRHINQIRENGVLEDYKDLLMFVETGFVGAWGEQHSGKYTSPEYKAQLLDAMLGMVPDDIPVTVRTPGTFAEWAGIEVSELDSWVSEPGSQAARVGIYNDGYMGSDSDLGTYSDREKETAWIGKQSVTSYFGGEFSGNLEWAQKYDSYLPENAVPEMYKTHLSYINSNIYNLYKDYTFGEEYDTANVDNSAYYGETVFKFIRDHIGYRFVLRDSAVSADVMQGDTLELDFTVENTGFANPVRPQKAEVILERGGSYVKTETDIDTRKWLSCTKSSEKLELKIPGGLDAGEWNVYLRLSVGNEGIKDDYKRSVRFANNGMWNAALGANLIGKFTVAESDDTEQITDNTFYQKNSAEPKVSDGSLYTVNNIIMIDGVRSGESEWTDSLLAAQNGDNRLYITNDDKYLYVMAEIDQSAASPVYNLQIKNADEDNRFYWIYYTPDGYVYFNNGSYDGCECRRSGKYAEFKIPFGSVMNIYPGTVLSSVRVSVQDSSNEWVNVGELTSEEYTVKDTFDVYSVLRTVRLKEHDRFTMNVVCSAENAAYQWLLDGDVIGGASGDSLTIENASADDAGMYSVQITSETGTVRIAEICRVADVIASVLKGDVNTDGAVDSDDAALLYGYLLKLSEGDSSYNYDVNGDGNINVFDAVAVKRIVQMN
ncbi:MAG: DUF4832 domain-containing protein [Porcipelethomonas sp.]